MRDILNRIEQRQAEYITAPFFAFLRDASLDAKQRLAFAPEVAHFVLTFADLCTMVLPREPATDRYQELVNANCREDKGHWHWYLKDLGELGRDPNIPYSDALRFIWSDRTRRTRRLSYHLAHWGLAADSLGRLVLVHCIEGAFKATVKDLEPAARAFIESSGKQLHYLGVRHAEAEDSHTIEQHEVHRFIESIPLTPEQTTAFSSLVDESFALFRAFTDEMLELARSSGEAG